ncbi:MAG: sensor histidine kinase [Egibacteraceae bacterium]
MLRRTSLAVLPAAVAAAAAIWASPGRPVATVAAVSGFAITCWLVAATERRVGRVADWALMLAAERDSKALELDGSREWRRLGGALTAVGAWTHERYTEVATQRARVERMLDNLPTAVLLFSAGRLAYANPAARVLFSLGRGGEDWSPLRVLGVDALAQAVSETSETGRTVEVEVRRDDRDLLARASSTGEDEVALAVTDLTETRRVESIRRDFVTNASHELKTPVAGILALSDSLGFALDRDPARARTMVVRLQREATRLAQLVRELLDLARMEETVAQHEQGRRRINLSELVRDQMERLAPLAAERQVTLTRDCVDSAALIGVPEDMRVIVANLIENGIQHNRPGGTVHTAAWRGGGEVVLEVIDTGLGIPESEQGRIFERFYRIDKGRSRAAGGTGLGLAIVRHATERHGGRVTVRSVLGEGSTFRVVLPVEGSST